jgi:SAM-dependent methyltransferase
MPGRDYWLSIAQSTDPDDLREHILTGFRSGKPFTPYVPTIALPSPVERVLDFGCGVGRTFPFLKTIARHVTGFDLPPMIERCRALATEPADTLLNDWNAARQRTLRVLGRKSFDAVSASGAQGHYEVLLRSRI